MRFFLPLIKMEKEIVKEYYLEVHPKTSFTVISKGRGINLLFDEITYMIKFGYETIIYRQGRDYITHYSLQNIQNDLSVNQFFRIHKTHFVSLKFIGNIKKI